MAEIFLARAHKSEAPERLVVVKRIRPALADLASFVDMFLDEARLAATLHHPNIVEVCDIGSQGGDTFFVMELLHGVDVRQLLRRLWKDRATVPVEHAVSIALGMCAGLHYAHEKGIVHRDVSPQNVFLTREGHVKLLDFGIAKAEARLAETSGDGGVLKGKVPYMSPEQARGQHSTLDRRSDVFSTCIVLWELLAGDKLYQAESDFLVLKRIIEEDAPSIADRRPDVPPVLAAVLARGLARDPTRRFETARELEVELETLARAEGLDLSPVTLSRYLDGILHDDLFLFDEDTVRAAAGKVRRRDDSKVARAPTLVFPVRRGRRRRAVVASVVAAALGVGAAAVLIAAYEAPPPARLVAPAPPPPARPPPPAPPPPPPPPEAPPEAVAAEPDPAPPAPQRKKKLRRSRSGP